MKLSAIIKAHYAKLLTIFGFLFIWQLAVMILGIKEFILPTPITTFSHLFIPQLAAQYDWFGSAVATTERVMLVGALFRNAGIGGVYCYRFDESAEVMRSRLSG